MYIFTVKENADIDIISARALLFMAAAGALILIYDRNSIVAISAVILLFTAALLVKTLLIKLKVRKVILIICAAIAFYISTRYLVFAFILCVYGILIKYAVKQPVIHIDDNGILIKKFISTKLHPWNELNNLVLKDNLLSIDFKSNKLLQVNIDNTLHGANEQAFNQYCARHITTIPGAPEV